MAGEVPTTRGRDLAAARTDLEEVTDFIWQRLPNAHQCGEEALRPADEIEHLMRRHA
jgi:hypothetical protein